MEGWIKTHRKFKEWEWYKDIPVKTLFIHLLLSANHKPQKWEGHIIGEGEVVTGIYSLSKDTGLTEQQIKTALKKLKKTEEISVKATNKFSVIKLLNWAKYQVNEGVSNKQITNNQQASNKQSTTNKNDKNDKNDKNISESTDSRIPEVIKLFEIVNPSISKLYGNKTQRSACERLLKKWTLEQIKAVVDILPELNADKYAKGKSITPLQLEDNLGHIKSFIDQRNKDQPKVAII